MQPHALASVSTPAQLLSLGPPVFVAVPSTLLSFIKRYPTMTNGVLKLATKPHGYRLPNAIITAKQLRFNNGLCFAFSAPAGFIKGAFSVAIKAQEQQLLLELSPILTTVEITAKCRHTDTAPLAHSISTSPEITAPKTSVSSYYRQFLTQLEQAPKAMEPRSNLTSTKGEHKVAADFLSLALAKAGALPQCSDKHNLTNALLKRTLLHALPKLLPETLISLSDPQQLQHALLSFARLNIQPTHWHAPSPDHANTLLFLCQWLLGKKASDPVTLTPLNDKLNLLQTYLGLSPKLAQQIARLNLQQPLIELLNHFSLYQQHSGVKEDCEHWFFTLPYSISHTYEQFEGHFERDKSDLSGSERRSELWVLRLKFTLSNIPLLITTHAKQAEPVRDKPNLTITFSCDDIKLLNNIEKLSPSLINKIEQLGMVVSNLHTEQQSVPATLLPGDHYLFKVKA
ncbi:hypothetical protein N9W21_02785 [Shewanella sp.]|nr:hypothetical protein [Shewanella sp.]